MDAPLIAVWERLRSVTAIHEARSRELATIESHIANSLEGIGNLRSNIAEIKSQTVVPLMYYKRLVTQLDREDERVIHLKTERFKATSEVAKLEAQIAEIKKEYEKLSNNLDEVPNNVLSFPVKG